MSFDLVVAVIAQASVYDEPESLFLFLFLLLPPLKPALRPMLQAPQRTMNRIVKFVSWPKIMNRNVRAWFVVLDQLDTDW